MTVAFDNTEEDATEAVLYMNQHIPAVQRSQKMLRIIGYVLLAVALAYIPALFLRFSDTALFTFLYLLGMGLFFVRFQPKAVRAHIKKMVHSGATKSLIGHQEYRPEPNGLWHRGPLSEGILFWEGIEKVVESEKYFALHFSSSQAFLIPKRAFSSPQHSASFLALIEQYRQQATGQPIPQTTRGAWWTQGQSVVENSQSNQIGRS
ncbi:MAG: YcxB family protein [Armatimonas sp.]